MSYIRLPHVEYVNIVNQILHQIVQKMTSNHLRKFIMPLFNKLSNMKLKVVLVDKMWI